MPNPIKRIGDIAKDHARVLIVIGRLVCMYGGKCLLIEEFLSDLVKSQILYSYNRLFSLK